VFPYITPQFCIEHNSQKRVLSTPSGGEITIYLLLCILRQIVKCRSNRDKAKVRDIVYDENCVYFNFNNLKYILCAIYCSSYGVKHVFNDIFNLLHVTADCCVSN
jgi:hypothetical protein